MTNSRIPLFYIILGILILHQGLSKAQEFSGTTLRRYLRSSGTSDNSSHTNNEHNSSNTNPHQPHGSGKRFPVATINWERVSNPIIISLWIIVAGLAKIALHFIHKVISRVPESCILICLGLVVGGIAYWIKKEHHIEDLLFNPDTFFLFILPPIVMEAGYFMPKEPFFGNLGTILTYALIGTIFNAMCIGASLYGVYVAGAMPGMEEFGGLTILHCLLFGSIISAVDPVAVISVFEEIHVNTILYICVFGESLLNDGVAVVLFKIFEGYIEIGEENIIAADIVNAVISFLVVALGGLLIGLIFGYAGSFITKFTVHNRIVEPTFVFVMCYLSYLTAEVFHLSGIIAIVFAAFTMSSYVEQNISSKSHTTVKYGMKMLANIAETIIFMLLGIAAVSDFWQYWNAGFVLWTLFFITIYRAIGVVTLTFLINYVRLEKINKVDQFVMAYGGLRGAIAFSLVSLTSADHVPAIKTMICACIMAILFTSFIQGSTIRPIVELLKVKTSTKHKKTMFEDINLRLIDHMMTGIEDVTGHHGHHYWMQRVNEFNMKYLAKWFIREPYRTRNQELLDTFHRINKRDAQDMVEVFERGNSSGELKSNATFANLLMPYDMRKSYSQTSFNHMFHQHTAPGACIDMRALEVQGKSKVAVRAAEDADVHHLLEENLYKPRTRETVRHRRGNIDEDDERKKQEQEIMIRHRITLQRNKTHFKHKHSRHKGRNSSKSPLAGGSRRSLKPNNTASSLRNESSPLLIAPSFVANQRKDENKNISKPDDDEGITFTAQAKKANGPKNGWNFLRDPLGFMSSFETLPEEPSTDIATEQTEVTELDSVALDRELPWKRSTPTEQAICDPSSSSSMNYGSPGASNSNELWPSRRNSVNTADEEVVIHAPPSQEQWDSMAEDKV